MEVIFTKCTKQWKKEKKEGPHCAGRTKFVDGQARLCEGEKKKKLLEWAHLSYGPSSGLICAYYCNIYSYLK